MTKTAIAGGAFAAVIVLLAIAMSYVALEPILNPATPPAITRATAAAEARPSFLYGRITVRNGATYEGRLRWGRDQEAFWGDYFNGSRKENTWAAKVPPELLRKQPRPVRIFGFEIGRQEDPVDLARQFMARFGDIARIEMLDGDVRVTLKSGTMFDLDYSSATDFGDSVRVWDSKHGVMDLDPGQVETIELLPSPGEGTVPLRLHGTVHTQHRDFTGFIQWDRNKGVGTDELKGGTADGDISLRFYTIRSIERQSASSSAVSLFDGRRIVLSGTREAGDGNLGMYVDDRRYGRVLITWDAFERVDFSAGGSGPAYGDFPAGRPLTGSVTKRDGRHLAGRLVYDLDESETTETLDVASQGVEYTIPFGMIASIKLPGGDDRARVTLHDGETLQFEHNGDLGKGNAGLLIFVDGRERPEYVLWSDVEQISLDRPPRMYPPQK